jgi:hypothetical protein
MLHRAIFLLATLLAVSFTAAFPSPSTNAPALAARDTGFWFPGKGSKNQHGPLPDGVTEAMWKEAAGVYDGVPGATADDVMKFAAQIPEFLKTGKKPTLYCNGKVVEVKDDTEGVEC